MSKKDNYEQRVFNFDLMRAIAIIIILFHHLPDYSFNIYDLNNFGISLDLSAINIINRYLGLGTFIFISGYLININVVKFETFKQIKIFLVKKFVRIFPLYYLALFFFFDIYGKNNNLEIFVHLLGLQAIFASKQISVLLTLWFVSLITIYYLLFIVFKLSLLNNLHKLIFLVIIPLLFAFCHKYLGFLDFKLILYYFIFFLGVLMAEGNLLQFINSKAKIDWLVWLFFPLIYCISFFITMTYGLGNKNFTGYYLINILIFSWVIFIYNIYNLIADNIRLQKIIYFISYSSYCTFLFHRPILHIMEQIMSNTLTIENKQIINSILILIGFPLIVIVSGKIQSLYDKKIAPLLLNNLSRL